MKTRDQFNALAMGFALLTFMQVGARATVRYVNLNSTNAVLPFITWVTASTNIQAAIDVAQAGDEIVVADGVYRNGGFSFDGYQTNRVALTKPLTVRSLNGPAVTIIEGAIVATNLSPPWLAMMGGDEFPGGDAGPFPFRGIRCAYVCDGAVLSGFTLRGGRATRGGGAFSSDSGLLTNCVLTGNAAVFYLDEQPPFGLGGGAYGGTLVNCALVGNKSDGGSGAGAYQATLRDCTISSNTALRMFEYAPDVGFGGGASHCALENCCISENTAVFGGGIANSTAQNCQLDANSSWSGGGAWNCSLESCSLAYNRADVGGGAQGGSLTNCALLGNFALYRGGGAAGFEQGGDWATNSPIVLKNCTLANNAGGGGSIADGNLINCILMNNTADGAVAINSSLQNCVLRGNSFGAVSGSTVINCTLIDNSFGAYASRLFNSILINNYEGNYDECVLDGCCTVPLPPGGSGNFTNAPMFVSPDDGDFRLQMSSPCINAGNSDYVLSSTDLEGNPRISGGVVDIGAYEFVFTPAMRVRQLLEQAQHVDLGGKSKQPLLTALAAAMASFERGNVIAAVNQLSAFQNKVRAQIAPENPSLAATFVQAAQEILEAVKVNSH